MGKANDGLRFFCELRNYADTVAIYIGSGSPILAAAKPLEFETHEPGAHTEPTINLQRSEAQALLNELWRCGLRPAQAPEGDGIKAHLADMRAIAFGKLNIQQPGG